MSTNVQVSNPQPPAENAGETAQESANSAIEAAPGDGAHVEQPDPFGMRDIVAQETMADAAIVMAIAACATFLVTLTGTCLIWRQVRLTREAVGETAKATRAMETQTELIDRQQRPWMTAKIRPIYVANYNKELTIEVEAEFVNLGRSSAVSVQPCVAILLVNEEFPREFSELVARFENKIDDVGSKVLPNETTTRRLNRRYKHTAVRILAGEVAATEGFMVVAVAAIYYKRAEDDPEWFRTIRPYLIQKMVKTMGRSDEGYVLSGFRMTDDDLTAEMLTVDPIEGEVTT